jgi:hypothetical protein
MKPLKWFDFLLRKKRSPLPLKRDAIADQFEAVVHDAYFHFPNPDPKPFEYAILHHSEKHVGWFIVIYFEKTRHLRLALENGLCYRYYEYLVYAFRRADRIADLSKYVHFDVGSRPIGDAAVTYVIEKLIPNIENVGTRTEVLQMGICRCGHPSDVHRYHRKSEPFPSALTRGWITCAVEDCDCFTTWNEDA